MSKEVKKDKDTIGPCDTKTELINKLSENGLDNHDCSNMYQTSDDEKWYATVRK